MINFKNQNFIEAYIFIFIIHINIYIYLLLLKFGHDSKEFLKITHNMNVQK